MTSPTQPDDVTIAALNYRVPLPSLGDSLDLYGIYASVDAGVVSDLFSVRGRGRVLGLRYTQNLARPRPGGTACSSGRGAAADRQPGRPASTAATDLAPDITLHPASLGYAGSWSEPGRQVELSLTGVHNLPRGSRGKGEAFEASRAGASASYALLRYGLKAQQALPDDWQVRVAFDGQYTRDALVSGEQYGIGGQDSVRGFDERELVDDRGNRATLELQTPDFGERIGRGVFARALALPRPRLAAPQPAAARRGDPPPHRQRRRRAAPVAAAVVEPAGRRLPRRPGHRRRPRGSEQIGFSVGYAY